MSIEKTIALYTSISEMLDTIETLFKQKKFKELSIHYVQFRQEQKKAMYLDQHLLHQLRKAKKQEDHPEMAVKRDIFILLSLMQEVQGKYKKIQAQMNLFRVMLKEELSRLNQGAQLLQKYHSGVSQKSGRRISRSY